MESNIVEVTPEAIKGKEFYIQHKAVIRETAETTKTRIVYDASVKATPESPSLNLGTYTVLVRQRAYPVVVTGDI